MKSTARIVWAIPQPRIEQRIVRQDERKVHGAK